jgi:hypothetical protein
MLWKRNKKTDPAADFDKTGKRPVIRTSICTGEKVAGFRDESGHIEELMLIAGDRDLEEFMRIYKVREDEIEKVW